MRTSRPPTERLTWITRSSRSSTDRRTWDNSPRICLENPARYSWKVASMGAESAAVSVRSLSPATGLGILVEGWGVLRGLGVRRAMDNMDPSWEDCLGIFMYSSQAAWAEDMTLAIIDPNPSGNRSGTMGGKGWGSWEQRTGGVLVTSTPPFLQVPPCPC